MYLSRGTGLNYQPPWLIASLSILRKVPVAHRLPAALDWRDKLIGELTETVRILQRDLVARDEELRLRDEERLVKSVEIAVVQETPRSLPEPAELELYRLRSQLHRSAARAEQERLLRIELEQKFRGA